MSFLNLILTHSFLLFFTRFVEFVNSFQSGEPASCSILPYLETRMRFELIKNGFAVRHLNHSATLSIWRRAKELNLHYLMVDSLSRRAQPTSICLPSVCFSRGSLHLSNRHVICLSRPLLTPFKVSSIYSPARLGSRVWPPPIGLLFQNHAHKKSISLSEMLCTYVSVVYDVNT